MRSKRKMNVVAVGLLVTFVCTCRYLVGRWSHREDVPVTTPGASSQADSVPSYRHVTKSLAELGKMDEVGRHVLFLNRVPKSGSEIIAVLLKWLQGWNTFKHVRLKGNQRMLDNTQQEELVLETYETLRNEAVPMSFDRDVYFVNFTRFDRQSPTYINLIRDPSDYLISRFHHLVYVSNNYKAIKLRTTKSIEECVTKGFEHCALRTGQSYDLAIPYFCGQERRCVLLNNDWALQRAKSNVEKYYGVVGVLEEVNATLEVFETKLPYFFKGVQKLYYRDLLEPFHRNRVKLPKASEAFRKHIKATLGKEYEFYEWIKSRLFSQLQVIYGDHNGH